MSSLEKGVLLMVAILVFVFALCIGLSWYSFEYLDWKTVTTMGLMLLPVIGAAAVVVLWSEKRVKATVPGVERREVAAREADPRKSIKPAGGGL